MTSCPNALLREPLSSRRPFHDVVFAAITPQGVVTAFAGWHDDDQGPDDTDRRSGTTALVRLRRGANRARRLRPPDLAASGVRAGAQGPCGAAEGSSAQYPVRDNRFRRRHRRRHPGLFVIRRRRSGRAHRQERKRASGPARLTDQRGGSHTRKTMALSRWAMHPGRPALSGRSDKAIRNSSV